MIRKTLLALGCALLATTAHAQDKPLTVESLRTSGGSLFANIALIKGEKDAVLVDAPFTRADAHRVVAMVLDNTEAVQREYIEAALTRGASRKRVVLEVVMPAAAPAIIDSMRTMIAVGWTYLVIAEIVGAHDGIGAVMMRAGRFLHVDTIMAGIFMIGILGVMTDLMFRGLQRLLFPWNVKRRV